MDYAITKLKKFADHRGFLIEFLKNSELPEGDRTFGQIYLTTIAPGCHRGNHVHRRKTEQFALVAGAAEIVLEDVDTKERVVLTVAATDDRITRIRVGPGVAHVIRNKQEEGGGDVVLCSYTNEEYDPDNLDQESYELS